MKEFIAPGRIELQQLPTNIPENTRTIVTFIDPNGDEIDLSTYLSAPAQAQSDTR